LRREQRRQDYESRNLGNFSRLFPIDDKYDMDFYLNILSTAFNLFYPIGKHVQWRKNYERIKVLIVYHIKFFLFNLSYLHNVGRRAFRRISRM
jgi:hypothetical protein